MVLALINQFDPRILDAINEYVDKRPAIDWKRVWGYTIIYKTRHYVTNGYPRGGYVYFHKEKMQVGTHGTWITEMMSLSTPG